MEAIERALCRFLALVWGLLNTARKTISLTWVAILGQEGAEVATLLVWEGGAGPTGWTREIQFIKFQSETKLR